jgi:hypothetical protein
MSRQFARGKTLSSLRMTAGCACGAFPPPVKPVMNQF